MTTQGITVDALLSALRSDEEPNGVSYTTEEIAEAMGCSDGTARRYIKKAIREGRLKNYNELRTTIMRPGKHLANVFRVVEQ